MYTKNVEALKNAYKNIVQVRKQKEEEVDLYERKESELLFELNQNMSDEDLRAFVVETL